MLAGLRQRLPAAAHGARALLGPAAGDAQQPLAGLLGALPQLRGRSGASMAADLSEDIAQRLAAMGGSKARDGPGLQQTVMPEGSRRTGVIAVKAGMTQEWDEWGQRVPLTVLWIDDCEVVQTKTLEREGYYSLQLGVGSKRDKQLHPRQIGHFLRADVPNKRKLAEFRVTPDALLPPRTPVTAAHFTPGQFVDVQGTTIGKGFQGVMKRWGFRGQPASHGNSLAHRAPGGIGGCQDPGKVWPGKKMAGRMGGVRQTVLSAYVFKVDPVRNLLYVRGQVPGHKGNFVLVRDAAKKGFAQQPPRPFPTDLSAGGGGGVAYAPKPAHNPFEHRER